MNTAEKEDPTPKPKKPRLLKEIDDFNKSGLSDPVSAAASVSPSPPSSETSSSSSSGRRSSPRAKVPPQRLLDPTDGSELEVDRRRRGGNDDRNNSLPRPRVVRKGDKLRKKFGDRYFSGRVKSGPIVQDGEVVWHIVYEDDDEEDMKEGEVLDWIEFEAARKALGYKMGVSLEEIYAALEQMNRPYGLNKAMRLIHAAKQDPDEIEEEEEFSRFAPKIGLKIRKNFSGASYNGAVVAGPEWIQAEDGTTLVKAWRVEYEDGESDDMEYFELFRWRANRPNRPHPSVGRQLCALELFSGLGIVAQAFEDRRFRVQSVDSDPVSNATMQVDIMELQYDDIGMVPDFIWASPPCSTYSTLAGTKHRDPKEGEFEKTEEARLHNKFLLNLMCVIEWTRRRNPHLIVVIENPEAKLREMPLMKEMCDQLGFKKTTVHYCAFGATEKKPTNLWSNDLNLLSRLNEFKCSEEKCPYYKLGNEHPRGARGNGKNYSTAQIPEGLAELVADYVNARFFIDRIPDTKQAEIKEKDKEELNRKLRDD